MIPQESTALKSAPQKSTPLSIAAATTAALFALTACADNSATVPDQEDGDAEETSATAETEESGAETESEDAEPQQRETQEAAGPQPRLGVTYEGGVAVLDGSTLEVLDEFDAEGFLRINSAGDGRHLFLTEGESFRLLDTGTWGEPHGDHNHYYTTTPLLSDITVDGAAPGHVVSHESTGTLFFDGTGEIHSFALEDLDADSQLSTEIAEAEEPHHGVAVVLDNGSRFETLGDEQERTGARMIDADGEEIARSEDCPGVHGEAATDSGVIAVGCEDGVLTFDGDEFSKIEAGPEYARIGNLFPAAESEILLGDYREDQDQPMTEVALIDAQSGELLTTDIGVAYNFQSLARGPEGQALVLAEDGQLHVLDPETGNVTDEVPVLEEWTEPEEWQEPRPAITVINDIAYITDPAEETVHMVDLNDMEVINSAELGFVPNEVDGVDGSPVEGVSDAYGGEHGEDEHEHHDHDHDEENEHEHDEGEHAHDH